MLRRIPMLMTILWLLLAAAVIYPGVYSKRMSYACDGNFGGAWMGIAMDSEVIAWIVPACPLGGKLTFWKEPSDAHTDRMLSVDSFVNYPLGSYAIGYYQKGVGHGVLQNRRNADGSAAPARVVAVRRPYTLLRLPARNLAYLCLVWPAMHLLTWGTRRARRGWRRRAGRCSTCNYDLRASSTKCPECGTRIAQDSRLRCAVLAETRQGK